MIEGVAAAPFWPVAQAFEKQIATSGGGAGVCVYYEGKKVVDLWGGVRDEAGRPWREETMSMSFSTSKGIMSDAKARSANIGGEVLCTVF